MYATIDEFCPVSSLKLMIQKTDPNAKSLFNFCISPVSQNDPLWFNTKLMKAYQFSHFMSEILKNAGCCNYYTNKYSNHEWCWIRTWAHHVHEWTQKQELYMQLQSLLLNPATATHQSDPLLYHTSTDCNRFKYWHSSHANSSTCICSHGD